MFDYEFVNATGFLRPDSVFIPDMIPSENLAQEPDRVFRYHGLKEDVYVPRFKPDSDVKSLLGVPGKRTHGDCAPAGYGSALSQLGRANSFLKGASSFC